MAEPLVDQPPQAVFRQVESRHQRSQAEPLAAIDLVLLHQRAEAGHQRLFLRIARGIGNRRRSRRGFLRRSKDRAVGAQGQQREAHREGRQHRRLQGPVDRIRRAASPQRMGDDNDDGIEHSQCRQHRP
jgi:hypothetical protein